MSSPASHIGSVIVAVRVRPAFPHEPIDPNRPLLQHLADGCLSFDPDITGGGAAQGGDGERVFRPGMKRNKNMEYKFDRVFDCDSTQAEVYEGTAKRVVEHVCSGISACVFAYGATGSGKTHSMCGTPEDPGVMVRTVDDLFSKIRQQAQEEGDVNQETFSLSLSYLEIYNETIRDLLVEKSPALTLIEDASGKNTVRGLTEKRELRSTAEVFQLLKEGNARRSQAPTDQNQQSSRSHAVLTIVVKKMEIGSSNNAGSGVTAKSWTAKLSLIDLAGSERAAGSTNTGQIQKEGANINTSLLALGNVISRLADASKAASRAAAQATGKAAARIKANTPAPTSRSAPTNAQRPKTASSPLSSAASSSSHIPYRVSKLTRLLKDQIGGACMTVMLAAVSPSPLTREDTHNTLKYAYRAKRIKVDAKANVQSVKLHMSAYAEQIKQLQAQVANLLKENLTLKSTSKATSSFTAAEVAQVGELRSRMQSLLSSKASLDAEYTPLKCSSLSLGIHKALYDSLR